MRGGVRNADPSADALQEASKTLLDRIELVEGKLAPALEETSRYADALGLAQSYADLKEKAVFVYKTVALAQQVHHPLQKDLLYLSAVLKKVDVPVLAAPLQAYAEVTEQLVLLVEKVRKKIESNLMGHHVGGAVPIYLNDKTEALYKFFGNDKAKYARYEMAPQGPEFVYRPVADSGKRVMIYDESARMWYLVRPEATTYDEVERIYHDSLLAGHLLSAEMLYRYTQSPTYEKLQETRQLARSIQKYLNGIDAFIDQQLFPALDLVSAWDHARDEVELPFDKPWEFEARFAFNHAFRTRVKDFFRAFHDGFCRQQCPDCAKNAALVRQRAVKFGVQDAASWKCELTPRWVLPVGELPLQFFAGIGWLYDQPKVERKYNVVIARVGQSFKATVAIENLSLDTSGDWYEHLEETPWRWKSLRTRIAPTGQVVKDGIQVTVFVEEKEWGHARVQGRQDGGRGRGHVSAPRVLVQLRRFPRAR